MNSRLLEYHPSTQSKKLERSVKGATILLSLAVLQNWPSVLILHTN